MTDGQFDLGDAASLLAAAVAVAAFIRSGKRDESARLDAAEARESAAEANRLAQQHLESSAFPFLCVQNVLEAATWDAHVVNCGSGPAVDVQISATVDASCPGGMQLERTKAIAERMQSLLRGTTVGPSQSTNIDCKIADLEHIFIGELAYSNAYGRRYSYEGKVFALRPKSG